MGPVVRADPSDAGAFNEAGIASLTAGRPEQAIGHFERAAGASLDHPTVRRNLAAALAAEAEVQRKANEQDAAVRLLGRAIDLHPTRLRYRVLRGRARFETGRPGDRLSAYEEFAEVLSVDPEYLDALVNRGEIAYAERWLPEAERCWSEAARLSPGDPDIQSRLDRVRREAAVEAAFEELGGSRFRIRFGTSVPRARAEEVRGLCESAHDELCARFGHHPATETVVTLYSPAEFRSATQLHGWVAGLSDGSIRLTLHPASTSAELRATVYHEYAHHVIRGIAPRTPAWLHEGLAQLAEGRSIARAEARLRLAGPLNAAALDAPVLTQSDPRVVGHYYDLALGFTRHLLDLRGDSGVQELLRGIGRLTELDLLMRQIYGGSRGELFLRWSERLAAG